MKKFLVIALLACTLTACGETARERRAMQGGLIGAGAGALIGGLAGGSAGSAVAGGAIGGVAGAVIGAETTPRRGGGCYSHDSYGRRYRVSCR